MLNCKALNPSVFEDIHSFTRTITKQAECRVTSRVNAVNHSRILQSTTRVRIRVEPESYSVSIQRLPNKDIVNASPIIRIGQKIPIFLAFSSLHFSFPAEKWGSKVWPTLRAYYRPFGVPVKTIALLGHKDLARVSGFEE
jgi:hypothetical protein